ncbi:MAG: cytochrome c biogenesis protein CcsA, partial [Planctomycetaceae bacterium]|nr:cytochrome c biogenesis protein CcsA [Planctomycetaceae bacterium]
HDWLLVLAWFGGLFYFLLVLTKQRGAIGLLLLPATLGLVMLATFMDTHPEPVAGQVVTHRWGMLHAASLVIGMGAVAASTLCGMMYLVQYHKLRGGGLWLQRLKFPSLEMLTKLSRWFVVITVTMLTVGLVSGFVLARLVREMSVGFRWDDPLVVGTAVVWLIMVAALVRLLTRKEQTGRQIALLTLMAGGFLLLTILGLMFLSGGIHGGTPVTVFVHLQRVQR